MNKEIAERLAETRLAGMRERHGKEIDICEVEERQTAWVFYYNTRAYLEGDFMEGLIGNGPVVVPKDGSEPWLATSAAPIEDLVD